jgi:hypothetical protein
MPLVTIFITLLLISGCAVSRWEQEGKTAVQLEQDTFACENMLEKEENWEKLTGSEKDALREKCMTEKGYHRKTQ